MNRKIKAAVIGLVVVVLILAGVMVVKKRRREILQAPTPSAFPLPVNTAKIKKGTLEVKNHYLGKILPLVSSKLAPRVTGHIVEVRVREGDNVRKGEILARLDDRPFVNQFQSIKAQLAGARSTLSTQEGIFRRDLILYKNKAISKERLDKSRSARDEAKARVSTLEEALKTAQLNLEYCSIKAPMDGVITRRLQDPGDLGVPGKAILEMEAPQEGYKVVVKVPQELVRNLRVGGKAYLALTSQEGRPSMEARITRIYPAVSVGTLATLEIDLPQPPFNLPSEATLDVALVIRRTDGLIVPLRALLHTTKGDLAFAVTPQNTIKVVAVQVLGKNDREAVVLGPLHPGERVALGSDSTLLRLYDGIKVKPVSGEPYEVR